MTAYVSSSQEPSPALSQTFQTQPVQIEKDVGVKFGLSKDWFLKNKHKMVPIFISGGECPGVNDYFAYVARALRKKGLIPIMVKNGIDGFTKPDLHERVALITKKSEKCLLGVGGAEAGTSRVNLLKQSKEAIQLALENMEGFKALLPIGGGDHAVFWTTFATGLADRAQKQGDIPADDLAVLTGKIDAITSRMVVVYKTIDGDVFGQPLGLRTAIENGQKAIYAAAASGSSMKKITVIGSMGADVGRLPIQAASKSSKRLAFLKASKRSDDKALYYQIRRFQNQVLTLAPEIPVSLQQVVDAVRDIKEKNGSATVVVSEGFRIREDDPLLRKLRNRRVKKYYDAETAVAWEKFLKAAGEHKDPHGNVKWAEAQQEVIVAAAIRKFLDLNEETVIRVDGKLGYGAYRGANTGFYDRAYAKLLGKKVAELVAAETFGVVVSLPADDQTIDRSIVQHLKNRPKKGSILKAVVSEISDANLLEVHPFSRVQGLKNDFRHLHAVLHWSPEELHLMGVLVPPDFDDTHHGVQRERLRQK